jgi:hypothetical protein
MIALSYRHPLLPHPLSTDVIHGLWTSYTCVIWLVADHSAIDTQGCELLDEDQRYEPGRAGGSCTVPGGRER